MIPRSVTGLSGMISLLDPDNSISKMSRNSVSGTQGLINLINIGIPWTPLAFGIKLVSWAINTNVFQESAGITPTTIAGQPVGFRLDSSQGAGYSEGSFTGLDVEELTNSTFDDGLTDWSTIGTVGDGTVEVIDGNAVFSSAKNYPVDRASIHRSVFLQPGTYLLTGEVLSRDTSFFWIFVGSTYGASDLSGSHWSPAVGTFYRLIKVSTAMNVFIESRSSGDLSLGFISFRQLLGNHWAQTTSPARTTYSVMPITGRKNLADFTDDLSGWGTRSISRTLGQPDPFGGNTAGRIVVGTNSDIHTVTRPISGLIPGETYTANYNLKGFGIGKFSIGTTSAGLGLNGSMQVNLLAGEIDFVYSGFFNPVLTPIGDGWYNFKFSFVAVQSTLTAIIYTTDDTYANVWTGDGVSGFFSSRAQIEKGDVPTSYQRVGESYDITEEGVEGIYYFTYDSIDDGLSTTLPEILDGQIIINSINGIWIAPLSFAGGTFTIGPHTYTGGPVGLLGLLGNAEIDIFILNEVMTVKEQSELVEYLVAKGSPGLVTLSDNLFSNGTFDSDISGITSSVNSYWEDGKIRCADGYFVIQPVATGTKKLIISWDQVINSGTRSRVRLRNQTNSADVGPFNYYGGSGSFSVTLDTTAGLSLNFICETNDDISFDNLEIREVILP